MFVFLTRVVLLTIADTYKFDSRTANYDAAIDVESAESLVSPRLQATTIVMTPEKIWRT